jgi:hypothetical protein
MRFEFARRDWLATVGEWKTDDVVCALSGLRVQGTLSNDDLLEMVRLTTAIGLEEIDSKRSHGLAVEGAARYVLTESGVENGTRELGGDYADDGGNASGSGIHAATNARVKYERSGSQVSTSSNGHRRLSDARSSLASDFVAAQTTAAPTLTTPSADRMISRKEQTSARRNLSRKMKDSSGKNHIGAEREVEQHKPPRLRRAGEETVEDRLIREWILRQARERATIEAARKRELDARNGRSLTREEIEQNLEKMKARDVEMAKRAEARRQAADEEARNLASSSVSSMMSKKTRTLSSKMPEFTARQREFMTRRAERIEQRRREIDQEKQTKEAADDFEKTRDRVPITRRAAATHRTLQDLEAWNERREEKIRAAKAKMAAEEDAIATFAPALDKHSLRLALRRRAAGFDSAESVAEAPRKESNGYEDCTFTPTINKHSTRIAFQNNAAETPVFDRLYSTKKTPTGTPKNNKSQTERWGGYGVDEADVLKVVARDGFIHLNELEDD